jgi:hypothetical protein
MTSLRLQMPYEPIHDSIEKPRDIFEVAGLGVDREQAATPKAIPANPAANFKLVSAIGLFELDTTSRLPQAWLSDSSSTPS